MGYQKQNQLVTGPTKIKLKMAGSGDMQSSRNHVVFPHWHFLVKLPHVLNTGLLGRIIHNGRVVRQELICGNIKSEKREAAWEFSVGEDFKSKYFKSRFEIHFLICDFDFKSF